MPFPGFLSQSDNLQFIFSEIYIHIYLLFFIMKILTDFRKMVVTGMDLCLTRFRATPTSVVEKDWERRFRLLQ